MREMILCKLGEVVLKGLNRRSFEDKLIGNLRRRTAKCGNFRIYSKQRKRLFLFLQLTFYISCLLRCTSM